MAPFSGKAPSGLFVLWGALGLIGLWAVIAWIAGPLVLASPWAAFRELGALVLTDAFRGHLGISLFRLFLICLLACGLGVGLAVPAALDRRVEQILEPLRWLCMSAPPVVLVVALMFFMGMGTAMIVAFGAVILWPLLYVNVLKSSEAIPEELWEMARAYELGWSGRMAHLFLPAVMPGFLAGAAQTACSAIRVTALAELIGANKGIGAAIASSARSLDSARLYAWVLVTLLLAMVIEFGMLRPLQRKAYRWKQS